MTSFFILTVKSFSLRWKINGILFFSLSHLGWILELGIINDIFLKSFVISEGLLVLCYILHIQPSFIAKFIFGFAATLITFFLKEQNQQNFQGL